MMHEEGSGPFAFPKWANLLRPALILGAVGGIVYATVIVAFGFSPKTTDVGYRPTQPVHYSHALHVGELGLDCRYCHNTVEATAKASIPPTQTCMNCHSMVKTTSSALAQVRESAATGEPIPWIRVHDLPDYVYFNHSAHVSHGIGCETCHGRIDTMEKVAQVEPLSMGWCLDCHRNPEPNLRPLNAITTMGWTPAGGGDEPGRLLSEELHVNPSTDCTTCHR